jgi:tripartite-type tricarboxylate transporter receptor subunit TctC
MGKKFTPGDKIMQRRTFCTAPLALGALPWAALAATWPERPVTLIVPYGPGGPTDTVGRLIAQEIEPMINGRMLVVNKPGASGTIGTGEVVRARPDGYTIGYSTAAVVGLQPLIMSSANFGSPNDYQPIVKLLDVPIVLAVKEDSPYRSFADFIADARKRPGAVRVAVAGKLTEPDLAVELLKTVASINLNNVPFTGGSSESLTAVLGGHVEAFAAAITGLAPHVEAKRIRVLTVMHNARHSLLPDVPTAAEAGFDVNLPAMHFLLAPKSTPTEITELLRTSVARITAGPRFQELAQRSGFRADPIGGAPLQAEIAQYAAAYSRLVKELKIPRQ